MEAGVREAGIVGLKVGVDMVEESSILVRLGKCLFSSFARGTRLEPEAARCLVALSCGAWRALLGSGCNVSISVGHEGAMEGDGMTGLQETIARRLHPDPCSKEQGDRREYTFSQTHLCFDRFQKYSSPQSPCLCPCVLMC